MIVALILSVSVRPRGIRSLTLMFPRSPALCVCVLRRISLYLKCEVASNLQVAVNRCSDPACLNTVFTASVTQHAEINTVISF